jgi:hypothetical protein
MPSLLVETPLRSFRPAPVGRCFRQDPEWIYARHYPGPRVHRETPARMSPVPDVAIHDDRHHEEDAERWDGMS